MVSVLSLNSTHELGTGMQCPLSPQPKRSWPSVPVKPHTPEGDPPTPAEWLPLGWLSLRLGSERHVHPRAAAGTRQDTNTSGRKSHKAKPTVRTSSWFCKDLYWTVPSRAETHTRRRWAGCTGAKCGLLVVSPAGGGRQRITSPEGRS